MIVHRRVWFYRLDGQGFAKTISFAMPVTASQARKALRRTFGSAPLELWSH